MRQQVLRDLEAIEASVGPGQGWQFLTLDATEHRAGGWEEAVGKVETFPHAQLFHRAHGRLERETLAMSAFRWAPSDAVQAMLEFQVSPCGRRVGRGGGLTGGEKDVPHPGAGQAGGGPEGRRRRGRRVEREAGGRRPQGRGPHVREPDDGGGGDGGELRRGRVAAGGAAAGVLPPGLRAVRRGGPGGRRGCGGDRPPRVHDDLRLRRLRRAAGDLPGLRRDDLPPHALPRPGRAAPHHPRPAARVPGEPDPRRPRRVCPPLRAGRARAGSAAGHGDHGAGHPRRRVPRGRRAGPRRRAQEGLHLRLPPGHLRGRRGGAAIPPRPRGGAGGGHQGPPGPIL